MSEYFDLTGGHSYPYTGSRWIRINSATKVPSFPVRNTPKERMHQGLTKLPFRFSPAPRPRRSFLLLATFLGIALALTPSAAKAGQGDDIVAAAASMAGKPYCFGGGNIYGPTQGNCAQGVVGFDCTGLAIFALHKALGITGLPHGVGTAWRDKGIQVARSDLQPGDVVFFGGTGFLNFTHVGIYAGNGKMWDAANYGIPVAMHGLYSNYLTAVRYANGGGGGSSPIGNLDLAGGAYGGFISAAGWVMDPDAKTTPTQVHIYIDGPAGSGAPGVPLTAQISRPDVAAAFPGSNAAHGFSTAISASPGRHTIYVYGIDIAGGGSNVLIKTATVDVPALPAGSPFGWYDAAEGRVGRKALVRGWTIDPDAKTTPTDYHVYVDGPAGSGARGINMGAANASRIDVGAAYAGAGAEHGFNALIRDLEPGAHTLWIYAINKAGGGANPLLGVKSVTIPGPNPIGNLDIASGGVGGFLQVGGWVMDPDLPTNSTSVHVYVDGPAGSGAPGFAIGASIPRHDVAKAFPGAGPRHGFSTAIAAAPGNHTLYVYGIDIGGGGSNVLLGTASVSVPARPAGSPFGNFDTATGMPGNKAIVRGWTVDPDAPTQSTDVHFYIDGPAGSARGVNIGSANLTRPDVGVVFPGVGSWHGFEAEIDQLEAGRHALWMYAINKFGSGANPLIGVKQIDVLPMAEVKPTGQRARARKRCRTMKSKRRRASCIRRAKRLPQ